MDDADLIESMKSDDEHYQATLATPTGSFFCSRPSVRAWVSYGFGRVNSNLPSFIVRATFSLEDSSIQENYITTSKADRSLHRPGSSFGGGARHFNGHVVAFRLVCVDDIARRFAVGGRIEFSGAGDRPGGRSPSFWPRSCRSQQNWKR